jgi:3-phosphoshikimate 1-carboxyvinyltransferase
MEIDCSQSSQFASAILLIGERIGLKKMIIIPQNVPSLPYLILTKEVIKRVTQNTHAFSIEDIESDWSGALFWYALCSLSSGSAFVFKNLSLDSLQGDAIISRWFNQLDVETTPLGKDIMIRHKVSPIIPPHDLSFDLLQHPDLAPVLSILLLLKEKESTLTGLQNLNFKESNRFDLIFNTLHQFSEVSVLDDNTLTIKQPKAPQNEQLLFCSHQDHRWVMAFLLFAVHNVIEMDDVECLKKSYPLFWSNF